jgi:adenine-specific DNA-methyltransferase
MVTTVISAKGVVRPGQFSRVEDYVLFVRLGDAEVIPIDHNMLDAKAAQSEGPEPVQWLGLRRREPSAKRGARPNQFYPVLVNTSDGSLHSIGEPLTDDIDRTTIEVPEGTVALWPLTPSGDERLWGLTPETARDYASNGFLRVRNWKPHKCTAAVQYLPSGTVEAIQSAEIETLGHDADGSVIAQHAAKMKRGEFQRSSQRTGHDDRHHPSDEPLEASAWQVQH